ncbi:MAG: hypothetical protein WCL18_07240 [bacterium]
MVQKAVTGLIIEFQDICQLVIITQVVRHIAIPVMSVLDQIVMVGLPGIIPVSLLMSNKLP